MNKSEKLKKIKKILETKESVSKMKSLKQLSDINSRKTSIETISSYRRAYLSASRNIENISAYELQNVGKFVSNLSSVEINEKNINEGLKNIYNIKKNEWLRDLKILNNFQVYESKYGIQNALKQERKELNSILELSIIKIKSKEK
jgi:flagellar biosynthesis chaperone FliJ